MEKTTKDYLSVTSSQQNDRPWSIVRFVITNLLVITSFVWLGYLHYNMMELGKRQREYHKSIAQPGGRYRRGGNDMPSIGEPSNEDMFVTTRPPRKKAEKHDYNSHLYDLYITTESLQSARRTLEKAMKYKHPYHPSIHLSPVTPHSNTDAIQPANLRWTIQPNNDHSTNGHGEYTGMDPFFEFDTGKQVIKILRTGRYNVYTQLTYNGRQGSNANLTSPSCGYGVKIAPNIGLMYNFVTQYRLGRMIQYDTVASPHAVYAHDSAYMAGVFILRAGEQLQVYHSPGVPCYIRTEPEKTFFGIWLLSEIS